MEAREAFERVAAGTGPVELARAALLIADEDAGPVDIGTHLSLLDELGAEAEGALTDRGSEVECVRALNHYLFDEKGFAGNRDTYFDASNSYLSSVLETRRGIPITLAIVWLEVAQRAGLEAHGVSFPGHFLVKSAQDEIVVDPFRGAVLSEDECEQLYRAAVGQDATFDRSALAPAPSREILTRVLRNLKQIYLAHRDTGRALACCDRALLLLPDHPGELLDRARLHEHLEWWSAAVADYERAADLTPDPRVASAIRAHLSELGEKPTTLQ